MLADCFRELSNYKYFLGSPKMLVIARSKTAVIASSAKQSPWPETNPSEDCRVADAPRNDACLGKIAASLALLAMTCVSGDTWCVLDLDQVRGATQ